MKNIIFLIIFIAAIAVIIAFNLDSKSAPEPVASKEPILIAKQTKPDAKPVQTVLPETKIKVIRRKGKGKLLPKSKKSA